MLCSRPSADIYPSIELWVRGKKASGEYCYFIKGPSLGKDCAWNSSGTPYLVDFRYFYALSFLPLNHSSLFSILRISEVESTIFTLLQIGDSRTGILRSKPSELFWFLIHRKIKNSNAYKGLGLTNLQALCTQHCGCKSPWVSWAPGHVLQHLEVLSSVTTTAAEFSVLSG